MIGIITLRLFLIGANLHIGKICRNRGYGERNPPSSLSGKQNPRSGFGVTLAKLALYPEFGIKGLCRKVDYPEFSSDVLENQDSPFKNSG